MVKLESKIAKWNPKTDSLQLIGEWMEREEELICYQFEEVEAISRCKGMEPISRSLFLRMLGFCVSFIDLYL